MADDEELKILIKAIDEASAVLDKVSKNIDRTASQAEKAAAKAAAEFKNAEIASTKFAVGLLAVATATGFAVKGMLDTAGQLEAAEQGFTALLGSAEAAEATMERIKQEAKATPFELPGLVKGTQALAAITKDGDKAIDILLDVGKAIAISGKGQAELDRVIINLQQIASTGKLTAMDIRQFQGAIPIFNDIVEATGMTISELQEADNAAELLFEAFKQAGAEGGIAAQGFIAQAGTFNQLVSNMLDAWTVLGAEFVESTGIFDMAKQAVADFTLFLEKAFDAIQKGITFFQENERAIHILAGAIIGALIPALIALTTSLLATTAALAPFIALGVLIAIGLGTIIELVRLMPAYLETLKLAWTIFSEEVKMSFIRIQTNFNNFMTILKRNWKLLWEGLYANAETIFFNIQTFIFKIWNDITAFFNETFEMLTDVWSGFWEGLADIVLGVWNFIVQVVKDSVNFVIDAVNSVIRAINSITSKTKVIGIDIEKIPEIPKLADGGIVTRPTLAMVGEAGPEAIIPLNKRNAGNNIIVKVEGNNFYGDDREFATKVGDTIVEKLNLQLKTTQ